MVGVELWSSHKAPGEEKSLVETLETSCISILVNVVVLKGLEFLKVVRLVFWSGVVVRSLALRARTVALRAHSRATRSKARLVSKSIKGLTRTR